MNQDLHFERTISQDKDLFILIFVKIIIYLLSAYYRPGTMPVLHRISYLIYSPQQREN